MRKSKQVIVMRKSFNIDGKKVTPRKGKYIAQGAHASLKAILDLMTTNTIEKTEERRMTLHFDEGSVLMDWIDGSYTKVCCVVETEEELLNIYNEGKNAGLICSLITDSGHTEFGNQPTITCCSILGWSDELEPITGNLNLF